MLIRKNCAKGFTLIELIVSISIIGILVAIAVPAYGRYVRRAYGVCLELENIEHTDMVFEQFLQVNGKDICPGHGVVTYVEGKVKCSVHSEEHDGDVPYL